MNRNAAVKRTFNEVVGENALDVTDMKELKKKKKKKKSDKNDKTHKTTIGVVDCTKSVEGVAAASTVGTDSVAHVVSNHEANIAVSTAPKEESLEELENFTKAEKKKSQTKDQK